MITDKIISAAINGGSYVVFNVFLLLVIREIAHKLIDKLITAVKANTAARIGETKEAAKLSEKIDAMAKRKDQ